MSHPAIAQVFDAGSTKSGLPYFVMELVDGIPIDEFVIHKQPPLRKLLQLFTEVCRGVHHAHQKGVIHRDLKPGNLLVTIVDKEAQPRVIDFGIAKATTSTDTTLTDVGQIIGTPLYMSPEQTDSLGALVDVRSDVYSLGTILYQLLCEQHPLDEEALTSRSVEVRLQAFRGQSIQPPSQALNPAGQRHWKRLDNELDWIVLKALALAPDERYESAAAFADDLQNYLQGQLVVAAPASMGYRLRKFVQRNRLAVASISGVFLSLLIGLGAATAGFVRATESEHQALLQAENARWVSEFLISLFDASHPDNPELASMTARELLAYSTEKFKNDGDALPATRAVLFGALGRVYSQMFMQKESLPLLEEADQLYKAMPEQALAHSDVLALLSRMNAEDGKLDQAVAYAQRAVDLSIAASGEYSRQTALGRQALATSLAQSRRDAQARVQMSQVLEIFAELDPVSMDMAQAHYNMAGLHFVAGDFSTGLVEIERAIAVLETVDPESYRIAEYYEGLGMLLSQLGRLEDAEDPMLKAVELARRHHGSKGARLGVALKTLALNYHELSDDEKALPMSLEIVAARVLPNFRLSNMLQKLAAQLENLGTIRAAQHIRNQLAIQVTDA